MANELELSVTASCWGQVWTRPGLELKTRSLLNIAMLSVLNRGEELGTHVRGALNNGQFRPISSFDDDNGHLSVDCGG